MGSIAIVGVGFEAGEPLTAPTAERLHRAGLVVVASASSTLATALLDAGIEHSTFDEVGLAVDSPVGRVIDRLVALAQDRDVIYATAGYPFMREGMLSGLLSRSREGVDVFPVLSPLQVLLMAFDIDLTADLDIIDARSLAPGIDQRDSHLIVTGVRNKSLARRVSAKLAEVYPSDHAAVVAGSLPDGGFAFALHTIGTIEHADLGEDAAVYVAPSDVTRPTGFAEFVRIIAALRAPDGCPWDRAQDHMSLRRHMIEEAYEAVGAIEAGDDHELADELGDVLLQVVLHAQIAAEEGRFTIDDVVALVSEKIRRRHPHIFGDVVAETPEAVTANWDAIKRDEKPETGLLHGIPTSLPALMYAQKISRRVVSVGFEWETLDDIWEKVHEEIDELKATDPGSPLAADEIGDLLFTVVNLARKQGIDAEEALRGTCAKFTSRWEDMERSAAAAGEDISSLGIVRLEALWQKAKESETS